MKREDLEKLGLSKEQVDSIMALHGQDVEAHKKAITTAEGERDQAKTQLTAANQQIESFKGMKKPEEVDAAVNEWKTKFDKAETDHAAELAKVKFDHALESALTGAKAKNVKAVQALLSMDALKLNDDGSILGLKEQLEKVQKENDFLFEGDKPDPKIVLGGGNQHVKNLSTLEAAAFKGAGIEPK